MEMTGTTDLKSRITCAKAFTREKEKGSMSCIYFLGFIGAAIYFISSAAGFWMGVGGFFKAIIWPAFLVFEAFKYLSI